MADTPTPRSYSQILDDILNGFLSRYGIKRLKVGGPILSFIEAAAQSDTRSTQDIFNLLNSISVDRATSQALDNIANDENVPRIPTSPATGYVDFTDTSFSKISTNLFPGAPGPNAGALSVRVNNASSFPSTGSLYIGRGSTNYEGPLAYSSITSSGSYWTITLSSGTTRSHNVNETVILAQGGTRTISSGTIVQTPINSISGAVKFSVLASKQIEDGEVLAENVEVIAQNPGIEGNVSAFTVQEISNSPFQGAAVTNPLPFTNGTSIESDTSLRDRIKDARQSRSKGTSLAITNAILGASSSEDNKTVISSSIIKTQDRAFLYIDDGTGYEESLGHVSQETLVDSALGGEIYFQLASGRPIAKANVESFNGAPFDLSVGSKLTVKVGGISTEHTFSQSQFRNMGTATAYEIVSSINSDKNILFNSRTSRSGLGVVLFAKSDTNEEIQVIRTTSNDANDIINFPTGLNYTVRLFKNDIMLYKDGQKAIWTSNSQVLWEPSLVSGDTLKIKVDGTSEQTVTVLNSSFLDNTTYSTVLSTNSLDSWVTVLNTLITGVTASKSGDKIILVSNLDNSSRAKVEITGGTLVTKGMFDQGLAIGADSDYTLNKNLGQIKLTNSLDSLDSLVVLTDNTRASVSSEYINSSLTVGAANVWFVVDDVNAQIRKTGIVATQSFTVSAVSNVLTFPCTSGQLGTPLNPYIQVGDWLIIWDPGFGPTERGVFRVIDVSPSASYFKIEVPTGYSGLRTLTSGGLVFVRSTVVPQTISIPAGTYSLVALSGVLNSSLIGAFSDVYRNTYLRVTTDTYNDTVGSIMAATADIEGQKLLLETGINKNNYPSHFASVSSQNSELGTPEFKWYSVSGATSPVLFNTTGIDFDCGPLAVFRKQIQAPYNSHYGNNSGHRAILFDITGNAVTTRSDAKTTNVMTNDRYFTANTFLFGAGDTLGVLVDNDYDHKSFSVPLFRNLNALTGQTYGTAPFEVRDADNSNNTLSSAFGSTTTLFNDFALAMNARGKSYPGILNKTILWRFAKYGPEGENVKISFVNPSAPGIATPTITTSTDGGVGNIQINMGSGAERTALGLSANNYFVTSGVETEYKSVSGGLSRAGSTVTATIGAAGLNNVHSLKVGDIVRKETTETNFLAGSKVITAVTSNTFQYLEVGSLSTSSQPDSFYLEPRPAGSVFTASSLVVTGGDTVTVTTGAHIYKVGDVVAFTPTFVSGSATISSGDKTLTSVGPTTVTWTEASVNGTYPIGSPYSVSTGLSGKTAVSYYKTDVIIGEMTRTSGNIVTVTVATTNLVGSHPYQVGDVVYLSSTDGNFISGPKIVTARPNSTSFTFTDPGLNSSNAVAVAFSSTLTDPNLVGTVVADDIVHIDSNSGLRSTLAGDHRVHEVSSTRFYILSDVLDTENMIPGKINSLNNLRFYPLTKPTASSICTLVTSTYSSLVSAKLVPAGNTGATLIDKATKDEFYTNFNNATYNGSTAISVDKFSLYDGINFVEATDAPNSKISLKNPVSGELTSDADFDNETFRLIPKTALNVVNWLNHNAVSGLANNAMAATDTDGGSVQLTSNTIGNGGAIQVNGGLGNLSSSVIIGVGESINGVGKISVDPSQDSGFSGNQWVYVQGTQKNPKMLPTISTLSIAPTTDPNEWKITANSSLFSLPGSIDAKNYQIEKHGKFMAYIDYSLFPTNLSSVQEGHRVSIFSSAINAANQGDFSIVKANSSTSPTFWVENPDGVEELVTCVPGDTISFNAYDSVAKGDALNISSNAMGSLNNGQFTVSRLDSISTSSFYVNGTLTAVGTITLGDAAKFIKIIEKSPIKLIKKIKALIKNTSTGNTDVLFYSDKLINKISENVESTMYTMDKLNFDTHVVSGLDGYSYNTGLLAEVHKIVYGDETSSSIYPGIAATPAKIDISGPLIKKISVTLEVRLKQNNSDTITRIKSAVASVINSSKVGVSIAISDIIEAANRVDGVMAVAVLSPLYSSGNDLIAIQSNEKPRILDVNADVAISVVS